MSMERTASYFTVGVFVTLAFVAVVGFLIWLAGASDLGPYVRYTVLFTDPVSGLSQESTVKYKGVDVGRILGMRLAPDRPDLVMVDIEVKANTPVRQSTTAVIEMQGMLGVSYVELETTDLGAEPPPMLAGEDYPVLKGQGSRLQRFFDDLPNIADQLETTLSSIDALSKEGEKTAGAIRDLSDNVNKQVETALSTFSDFSKEGAKTASSLRELSDNANKQLDTALSSIDDFSKEGSRTASSLRALTDNANKRLDTTLSSIEDFSKEASRTAASIRGLTDRLKEDPSQILRPRTQQRGVAIAK
jgi:phospholipid/cholesterol/gamma-HCH transport system substrate-binding protein